MSLLLRLYWEYAKIGLFSVGGGLATIPFLADLGERTGWFTAHMLADMIAVSESTPGPIGVNMATYVGFHLAGIPGALCATLGLVTPSILVILLVAKILDRFRTSFAVTSVFYGLRPASVALIASAGITVAKLALFRGDTAGPAAVNLPAVLLAALVFVCIRFTPLKKIHPFFYILFSAAVGIALKL